MSKPEQVVLEGLMDSYVEGDIPESDHLFKIRKRRGYWMNLDNVVSETEGVLQRHNLDILPGARDLRKLGYFSLTAAINNHGGFPKFRKFLGQPQVQKTAGVWKDLNFFLQELTQCMIDNSYTTVPTLKQLNESGRSDIVAAMAKYHGGMTNIRKVMGEKEKTKVRGYWNVENTVQEAKKVYHDKGFLPTMHGLTKMGMSSLALAIAKNYGYSNMRKMLGEKPRKKEPGPWRDLDYTVKMAMEAMEDQDLTDFPGAWKLRKLGYYGLVNAIYKHHGGMIKFRKIIRKPPVIREQGIWKDLTFTIEQALLAMEELGTDELPSHRVLQRDGFDSLRVAIAKYHGGLPAFRDILRNHMGKPTENKKLGNLLEMYAGGTT